MMQLKPRNTVPRPDASSHNPDPRYLRGLLKKAGISQRRAAELLGLGDRVMRYYRSEDAKDGYRPAPYTVQPWSALRTTRHLRDHLIRPQTRYTRRNGVSRYLASESMR